MLGYTPYTQQVYLPAQASVSELMAAPKGTLRIGASVTIGQQVLKPALGQFLAEYPGTNLDLESVIWPILS